MRQEWIKYLCDPIDKTSLRITKIFEKKGQNILFGTLKSKSGNIYRIKEGVPILLNRHTQSVRTVDSFAYEWKEFDFDYGKKGWLQDIVKPIVGSTKYFKNKTIVDCGSGSGRQSLWMAQAGAKFVFSIELSDSARSMVKKIAKRFKDKIFVIQADITHLPINRKSVAIDLAYCINVIQHTKSPRRATLEISKLLSRSSDFIFNIYLRRGNLYLLDSIQFFRKMLAFFPNTIIKFISLIVAIFTCFLKAKGHSFKEFWLDIYDLLGSHSYQKFYSEEYLSKILAESKLKIIKRSYYAMILKKISSSV